MSASIDWRYWRISPEIHQWEACALSIGLNPESMTRHPQEWMAGPGTGPIFTDASFPNREAETEFKKRQRLLEASVFTSGFFPTVRGLVMGARWKATIRLDEFASWGANVGLDMPLELCASPAPVSKPQVAPVSGPVTPAALLAKPQAHRLKNREAAILTAEIDKAKENTKRPDDSTSVWTELTKLAESGYGAMIGFSSDGIQYRGREYQSTQIPDVFSKRNLRERMTRKAAQGRV